MKKALTYILVFIVIIAFIVTISIRNKKPEISQNPPAKQPIGMCYRYSKSTSNDLADRALLAMSIVGDTVTGEYQNLPAEKDKKIGTFSGTVGKMDPKISGRIADVWWNSSAEGMNTKEQLNIEFGEGSAVALFGEMVDRGDGVYVYKDSTKLTSGFEMSQVDCDILNDEITVEKYVRANIQTIAPLKATLGGSWYVTSVNINPTLKTGIVTYEDGHSQAKASFRYVRNGEEITISAVKSIK